MGSEVSYYFQHYFGIKTTENQPLTSGKHLDEGDKEKAFCNKNVIPCRLFIPRIPAHTPYADYLLICFTEAVLHVSISITSG